MKGSQILPNQTFTEVQNIQRVCTYAAKSRGALLVESRLGVDNYALSFWEEKFKDESVGLSRYTLWKKVLPPYVSSVMNKPLKWMSG